MIYKMKATQRKGNEKYGLKASNNHFVRLKIACKKLFNK